MSKEEHQKQPSPVRLSKIFLLYNFFVLAFDRLIEAVFPFLLWVISLMILGFMGAFSFWGDCVKTFFSISLTIVALGLLLPLKSFCWPSKKTILEHIEKDNHIPFQALQIAMGVIDLPEKVSAQEKALWQAHQEAMQQTLPKLRQLYVTKDSQKKALWLGLFLLCLGVSFFYSHYGKKFSLLDLTSGSNTLSNWQFEAYVTPPPYSEEEPIYLSKSNDNPEGEIAIKVPLDSKIFIHFFQDCPSLYRYLANGKKLRLQPQETENNSNIGCFYQSDIINDDIFTIKQGGQQISWQFVTPIYQIPKLIINPKTLVNTIDGELEFSYQKQDNFGFKAISMTLEPVDSKALQNPLPFATNIALPLEKGNKSFAQVKYNFSRYPLAGQEVFLKLEGVTKKGQAVKSEKLRLFLPHYKFFNPLAAAIAEIRQNLLLAPENKLQALNYLLALRSHEDETIAYAPVILALSSATARLEFVHDRKDMQSYVNYLWQIAMGIEKIAMSDAKRQLKNIEDQLAQAIARKEKDEKIRQLTTALHESMKAYIQDFMKHQSPQPAPKPPSKGEKIFTQNDVEQLLQKIEQAMKKGDHAEADRLLKQFSNLMENLRAVSPEQAYGQKQNGQAQQKSAAEQQMDFLSQIIVKQEKILNDTHQLQNSYNSDQEQNPNFTQKLKDLGKRQHDLAAQLKIFKEMLSQNKSEKNLKHLQESLDLAQTSMIHSYEALQDQSFYQAKSYQNQAIQALRKLTKDFIQKINQKGNNKGEKEKDPMGRSLQPEGEQNKLEGLEQKKRSRELLDKIRKFYQEKQQQNEKRYYQRLLDLPYSQH